MCCSCAVHVLFVCCSCVRHVCSCAVRVLLMCCSSMLRKFLQGLCVSFLSPFVPHTARTMLRSVVLWSVSLGCTRTPGPRMQCFKAASSHAYYAVLWRRQLSALLICSYLMRLLIPNPNCTTCCTGSCFGVFECGHLALTCTLSSPHVLTHTTLCLLGTAFCASSAIFNYAEWDLLQQPLPMREFGPSDRFYSSELASWTPQSARSSEDT